MDGGLGCGGLEAKQPEHALSQPHEDERVREDDGGADAEDLVLLAVNVYTSLSRPAYLVST